jgi:hypothetical protein
MPIPDLMRFLILIARIRLAFELCDLARTFLNALRCAGDIRFLTPDTRRRTTFFCPCENTTSFFVASNTGSLPNAKTTKSPSASQVIFLRQFPLRFA